MDLRHCEVKYLLEKWKSTTINKDLKHNIKYLEGSLTSKHK